VLLTAFVADKRTFKYGRDEKLLEATHAAYSVSTQTLHAELSELLRLNSETI